METLYAKVNTYGIVENVIVVDTENSNVLPDNSFYVQTFVDANGDSTKRYNLAVVGGSFDSSSDAFYSPQPFNSWLLSDSFQWIPPSPYPADGKPYRWNESALAWVEIDAPAP